MKRCMTAGCCLATMLACAAIIASTAQAVEYGRCVKLSTKPYTGLFVDKNCIKEANSQEEAEGKVNKYQWVPGPGLSAGYTLKGKTSVLKSAAGEVTCKKNAGKGKLLTAKTGEVELSFEGCVLAGTKQTCQNKEGVAGVIRTFDLLTEALGDDEEGAGGGSVIKGEVWLQLIAKGRNLTPFGEGPFLTSFECGTTQFAIGGSVAGVQTVDINSMQKKSELGFGAGKGEQALEWTLLDPISKEVETVPSEFVGSDKVKYEEKGELRDRPVLTIKTSGNAASSNKQACVYSEKAALEEKEEKCNIKVIDETPEVFEIRMGTVELGLTGAFPGYFNEEKSTCLKPEKLRAFNVKHEGECTVTVKVNNKAKQGIGPAAFWQVEVEGEAAKIPEQVRVSQTVNP
ncbi:MAG TPA: hypothetical protein VMI13_00940 [Solirubrobacteraceae bacterium]|nr:hypothetical protein [Solirubrobacteraceae bacterium]